MFILTIGVGIAALAGIVFFCLSIAEWVEFGIFDEDVFWQLAVAVVCFVIALGGFRVLSNHYDEIPTYACTSASCDYEIETQEYAGFCPDCGNRLAEAPDTCGRCGYDFSKDVPAFCIRCGEPTPIKHSGEGQ